MEPLLSGEGPSRGRNGAAAERDVKKEDACLDM